MSTLVLTLKGHTLAELLAQLDDARAHLALGIIRAASGTKDGPSWNLDDDHVPYGQSVYLTQGGEAYTEDQEDALLLALGYQAREQFWTKAGEENREPADVLCDLIEHNQIELRLRTA